MHANCEQGTPVNRLFPRFFVVNEAGKGDHKHVRGKQLKYRFVSVDKLVADFFRGCEEVAQ